MGKSGNKYLRIITQSIPGDRLAEAFPDNAMKELASKTQVGNIVIVDVYDIINCLNITDPGLQHAVKKLLFCGTRGKNDSISDMKEAIDAIERSIDFASMALEPIEAD